jgi:hypothetical protein
MKQYILAIAAGLCLALAPSCMNVQAETAPNVSKTKKGVTILHETAEFTAYYDQHLVYQIDGNPPVMVFADVFRQDGCLIAQMSASDYVRIDPATGSTNARINGKVYILNGGMVADAPQPSEIQRP